MTSQTSCSGWRDPSSVFAGPTIISLSSYYSPAGSTSLVVVLGANFYSYSIVRFGTFTPTVYFINSGQLQFYVPSSLFPGTYPVQVFNGAVGSNIVNYTIDNSSGYWILNPDGSITNSNVNGLAVDGIVGQTLAGGVGNYQYGDVDSLASITSGISNIAIGKGSAPDITAGNYNIAIGQEALMALTTGSQNVCIGTATMRDSAVGVNNTTAVGQGACRFVINGKNVGLGVQAIGGSGSANAFECTGIGTFSLQENGGNQNSALGCNAGYYPSGSYNTYLGFGSGQLAADAGVYNRLTCIGAGSGQEAGVCASNRIVLGSSTGNEDVLLAGSGTINRRDVTSNISVGTTQTTGNIVLGNGSATGTGAIVCNRSITLPTSTSFSTPVAGQLGYTMSGNYSATPLGITSGTIYNIQTISLTVGVWMIVACFDIRVGSAGGTVTKYISTIATANNNLNPVNGSGGFPSGVTTGYIEGNASLSIAVDTSNVFSYSVIVTIVSPTQLYLNGQVNFLVTGAKYGLGASYTATRIA